MSQIKLNKRVLSWLMVIVMTITLLPATSVRAATTTIAEWVWSGTYVSKATGGVKAGEAELTCSLDVTASGNYIVAQKGWDTGNEYWLMTVPKAGYENLQLDFGCRSSNTGPGNFELQASTNGIDFQLVKTYDVKNATVLVNADLSNVPGLNVNEADYVYIKLAHTSKKPVSGEATGATGTSRIFNVKVTGTPSSSGGEGNETQVRPVTASTPSGSTVEVGTEIQFATTTTGCAIYLDLNDTGYTTSQAIRLQEDDFVGDPAKATIRAYATKDGLETSPTTTFEYFKKVEAPVGVQTIAKARTQALGDTVVVEGTVTKTIKSSGTNDTNCTVYIQDNTAGIAVYIPGITLDKYPNGTKVKVSGPLNQNVGVLQIKPTNMTDIQVLNEPVVQRVPEEITMDQLLSMTYEGKLVKLVGMNLDTIDSTSNHTIKDVTTGKTVTMRCTESTTLPEVYKSGMIIDVVGISANFNGKPQLLVSKIADITKGQDAEVLGVTATPDGGSQVPLNSIVTLTTATTSAQIVYTVNASEVQKSATNKAEVVIKGFDQEGKATIKAKATNGNYTTPEVSFSYTQAKVEKVTPSVPVGAIDGHSQIGLTTTTHDANITYILTTNVGLPEEKVTKETKYTELIVLKPELFPVKIEAWASATNYLDSEKAEFNYRLKSQGGMQNYYGQLHSHTAENSDGQGTIKEGFEWARDLAGLDFFAITDHSNSFDKANTGDKAGTYNLGSYNASNEKWQNGQREAEAARTPEYVSVYGYEMTWSGGPGHMNTFATEGFVSRNNKELNNKTNDAGLKAYYELLKKTPESISQFNHPGKTFGTFSGYAYYDPIIDERVTLIEVGNGEGAVGSGGYFPSYEEYTAALDKGWHLAPTNNQDNHKKGWGTANTARTVIYTDNLSVDGVYEALRERRVYATEDNNLDIVYTLNDEVLGSILGDVPDVANFKVSATDPDATDRIKSIEIITNGGKIVYKESYDEQNVDFEYTLDNPRAGYYYIKVVQADRHIAVTAPIWLGQDRVVGISKVDSSASMPVVDEPLTLTTELFNNEQGAVTLKSIAYDYKDGDNIATQNINEVMNSNTTYQHKQSLTPTKVGEQTIVVTAVIEMAGEPTTFKSEIKLDVRDGDQLIYVGIDASHFNEYVNGNYKDSMGNFGKLAESYNVRTVELRTSEALLSALENPKYEMIVLTAPSRRNGTTGRDPYANYSQTEIEAIAKFAAQGKTVIIAGWSDFYENYENLKDMPEDEHMAAQQNKLLQAMGASLCISDDGSLDDVNNGGQSPRLYLTDYNNYVSPLTKGIEEGQVFSHYGGATIHAVDQEGTPVATLPENVMPIISGHQTTYSKDQDKDGLGGSIPRYNDRVLLMASETLTHETGMTSEVIVAGAAFMSNFEIQAEIDNSSSKNYSNYNILENILKMVKPQVITPISEVKQASEGTRFTIEGIATSSVYNGSDSNKGFFDCIYVEDATGGINLFPVSSNVTAGQKIRVTGVVSSYQDELQLKVSKVEVIDETLRPLEPTKLSTKDAMLKKYTGKLVEVTGKVEEVSVDEGVINQIMINDGTGPARIFINGYITKDVSLDFVKEGVIITAVGLASIGENFSSQTEFLPRLRVRDRGEIKFVSDGGEVEQPSNDARLSQLTVSQGTLRPDFKAEVFNYTVAVSNSVKEIKLEAVAADAKATVVGTGTKSLQVGKNTFTIVVTAEDGITTQTYAVVVTRAASESSGGGSGSSSSTTTTPVELTATQAINKLTTTEKDQILNKFKKDLPYTRLEALTVEQLHKLTEGKFTKAQLKEILEKPELLKALGIDLQELSKTISLEVVEDATFSDVLPTHWANANIKEAGKLGLVVGRPDGSFGPSEALKVSDTFTFLDRLLLLHGITDMNLSRSTVEKYIIDKDHWAFASIASVGSKLSESTLEAVSGLGENELTRELLAQVIYEVTKGKLERSVVSMTFTDLQGSPYEEALLYCVETGILKGVSSDRIEPYKALTRAELMTILVRLDGLLKK
nr:CehA/McbA family metallohydrolase [uncultured Niameybacter sp.]